MQLSERERIELIRIVGLLVGLALVVRLVISCPLLTALIVLLML